MSLHFANFLDPELNIGCEKLAELLSRRLCQKILFNGSQAIDHRLADHYELAFLCGLPYSVLQDTEKNLRPLCAPIFIDERIQDSPLYFADVIVRSENKSVHGIHDLKGLRCAYNHKVSLSGYLSLASALRAQGHDWSFFSSCVPTGSHAQSIQLIHNNSVDVAAIDSHVLALQGASDCTRLAFSLGPFPAPPLLASTRLSKGLQRSLTKVLTRLHETDEGKMILSQLKISRFVPIDDQYYDPIRTLSQEEHLGYDSFHEDNYTG